MGEDGKMASEGVPKTSHPLHTQLSYSRMETRSQLTCLHFNFILLCSHQVRRLIIWKVFIRHETRITLLDTLRSKFTEKYWSFFYLNWFSMSSGVGGSKEEKLKKKKINLKKFSFKILKIPSDFDYPFFYFSYLCYQL